MFQFQNGAIIRWSTGFARVFGRKFQFQNGAIIRCSTIPYSSTSTTFQFQNGAIISRNVRISEIYRYLVSIPKWCDYKDQQQYRIARGLTCFNSKMVRL